MKQFYLIIILSLALACKQGKPGNEASIKLTDTQGLEVALNKPAERIVCLFDPSMDVLYMLQAEDKLVGIPAEVYFDAELFDYYKYIDARVAEKSLPTPGSNELANAESILRLNPDLVIAKHLPESIIGTLNNLGVAVYLASSESYKDLVKEMKDIAELIGKEKRGVHLINYAENKIKELNNEQANSAQAKSVYFTWANGRIYTTAGRTSMMNDCLELAGVENVCPSEINAPNINPETLMEWNPDIIVMWNDSPDLFYNKKELSSISAVKNKQIYNLMPMFYYNPHTFKALCTAVAIHHWSYPDETMDVRHEVEDVMLVLYGQENGANLMKGYK